MVFSFAELAAPVVAAPMADGPSTPELAAAVSNAGGLGFVASGHLTPRQLADDIDATRAITRGPVGVNLFVPQPSVADVAELDTYAAHLEPFACYHGVHVGLPRLADDDCWPEKLEVMFDVRPTVVSFTFGTPPPEVLDIFRQLRVMTLVTVTSPHEADIAMAHGADSLIVQGPGAGWHRGTFAPNVRPGTEPLDELLQAIRATHGDVPLVATGGLGTPGAIARVLQHGAVAAQVGTALLLADEAGTDATHRAALQHGEFGATVITAAFTGRYARCLENDFTRALDYVAPLGYPEVSRLTAPIRAAAIEVGDPHSTSLWAGTAYRVARPGPAAQIVTELTAG